MRGKQNGNKNRSLICIMPKHHCCAYNCNNSKQKTKNPEKYPELAHIEFFPFPPDNPRKCYAPGMSEQERRKRWIVACRLESLNVTRHTRICSVHFDGGLGPTKANPVPTIFSFPEHLQQKTPVARIDPEERRKRFYETPQSALTARAAKKVNKKLYASPERPQANSANHTSDEDFTLITETLSEPECQPKRVDAEVQTDLTSSDIQSMQDMKGKFDNRSQLKRDLFLEDVCRNDRTVRFYTGIPSLACLLMLFDFLKPIAEKMKYWDGKKKTQKESYQVGRCIKLL